MGGDQYRPQRSLLNLCTIFLQWCVSLSSANAIIWRNIWWTNTLTSFVCLCSQLAKLNVNAILSGLRFTILSIFISVPRQNSFGLGKSVLCTRLQTSVSQALLKYQDNVITSIQTAPGGMRRWAPLTSTADQQARRMLSTDGRSCKNTTTG